MYPSLVCIVVVCSTSSISAGMRIYFRPFTISLSLLLKMYVKYFIFSEPATRALIAAIEYYIMVPVHSPICDCILYYYNKGGQWRPGRIIWSTVSGTHMLHILYYIRYVADDNYFFIHYNEVPIKIWYCT